MQIYVSKHCRHDVFIHQQQHLHPLHILVESSFSYICMSFSDSTSKAKQKNKKTTTEGSWLSGVLQTHTALQPLGPADSLDSSLLECLDEDARRLPSPHHTQQLHWMTNEHEGQAGERRLAPAARELSGNDAEGTRSFLCKTKTAFMFRSWRGRAVQQVTGGSGSVAEPDAGLWRPPCWLLQKLRPPSPQSRGGWREANPILVPSTRHSSTLQEGVSIFFCHHFWWSGQEGRLNECFSTLFEPRHVRNPIAQHHQPKKQNTF